MNGHDGYQQRFEDRFGDRESIMPRPVSVNGSFARRDVSSREQYLPRYQDDLRRETSRSEYSTMGTDSRRYNSGPRDSSNSGYRQEGEYRRNPGSNSSTYHYNSRPRVTDNRWRQPKAQPDRYVEGNEANDWMSNRDRDHVHGERNRHYEDDPRYNQDLDGDRRPLRRSLSPERSSYRPEQQSSQNFGFDRAPQYNRAHRPLLNDGAGHRKEQSFKNLNQSPVPASRYCFSTRQEVVSREVTKQQPRTSDKTAIETKSGSLAANCASTEGPGSQKRPSPIDQNDVFPPNKRWRQSEDGSKATHVVSTNVQTVSSGISHASVSQGKDAAVDEIDQKKRKSLEAARRVDRPPSFPSPLKSPLSSTKSSSASTTKVEAPKTSGKLGIPMRWLKPAAKPEKSVAPTPHKSSFLTLSMIAKKTKSTGPDTITLKGSDGEIQQLGLVKETSKTVPTPSIQEIARPSSPSNRLVTDTSEGGSTISNKESRQQLLDAVIKKEEEKIPFSIVTKPKKKGKKTVAIARTEADAGKSLTTHVAANLPGIGETSSVVSPLAERYAEPKGEEWDSDAESVSQPGSETESDVEDEETELWAARLLGKAPLDASFFIQSDTMSGNERRLKKEQQVMADKELEKLQKKKKKDLIKKKASLARSIKRKEFDEEKARKEMEEERRKREEAKPLTAEEIKAILGDDDFSDGDQNNWVRRSVRQPSRALLNSKPVRMLIEMLRVNHPEMKVLKMKKFINDPNAPSAVLDAALNAMEENSNCEALYIQVCFLRVE